MKADAWHYELVGSQMGMAVMEHSTPRMVITHSPPLTSRPPLGCRLGGREGGRERGKGEAGQEGGRQLSTPRTGRWWTPHPCANKEHKYITRGGKKINKSFELFFLPHFLPLPLLSD